MYRQNSLTWLLSYFWVCAISNTDFMVIIAIAMVILKLMNLDQTQRYYRKDRKEVLIGNILFNLGIAGKRYSEKLIDLIKRCFEVSPQNRCSFKQAREVLTGIQNSFGTLVRRIRLDRVEQRTTEPLGLGAKKLYPFLQKINYQGSESTSMHKSNNALNISSVNKLQRSYLLNEARLS